MVHTFRTSMFLAAIAALALGAAVLRPPERASALSAPTITEVSPASGPIAGGTVVAITGTGFLPGAVVFIGGAPVASTSVNSDTQIVVTTPQGTVGPANVLVRNPDFGAVTRAGGFYYVSPASTLTVSGVSPASGSNTGGISVNVTGTGFVGGATVFFGGTPSPLATYQGPSLIVARVPPSASGTVPVTVKNPDGTTVTLPDAFTSTGGVRVESVNPRAGATSGGATVLITGNGFTPGASVFFDATPAAPPIVVNSTQIIATTPASPSGYVAVKVVNPGGASGSLVSGFRYAPSTIKEVPTIISLSPSSGPTTGGTIVTMSGTNFAGGAAVLFGGVPSPEVSWNGASSMFVHTPSNVSGPVPVTVINVDGGTVTLPAAFTYQGSNGLTASAMGPASGSASTIVTITGTGFPNDAWVTFGNVPATTTTVLGSNEIVAVAPAGTGTVQVKVNGLGGLSATLPGGFTYTGGTGTPPPATPPEPPPPAGGTGPGTFAAPPAFSSGTVKLAQAVFNGGTIAQLDAALQANNASGAWAQTPAGTFVLYIVGAPSFANEALVTAFPNGFPGVVALTLVGK